MRIRVRGPTGAVAIAIDNTATWGDLRREISTKTNVDQFQLKYGYPPQNLDTSDLTDSTPLSSLPVKLDGEQLTLVPTSSTVTVTNATDQNVTPKSLPTTKVSRNSTPINPERDPPEIPVPNLAGTLVLRVMPDDNSCLFRALGTAVLGPDMDTASELRSVVAQTIQSEPDLYTAGLLHGGGGGGGGNTVDDYCNWIQSPDSWGGGIELAILSKHFAVEIASVNVQDLRVDRFNEGVASRVVLVYSGIHYDVAALESLAGQDERRVFDVVRLAGDNGEMPDEDGGVLDAARELCRVLQQRHYYTDTQRFDVRCNTCGWTGKGERSATTHATETGHVDFGEA